MERCITCNGDGGYLDEEDIWVDCLDCDGTGYVISNEDLEANGQRIFRF